MAPAIRVGAVLGVSSVASAFLISVAGYALAAMLVQALLRPDPLAIARRVEPPPATAAAARRGRPTGAALRRARARPDSRPALGSQGDVDAITACSAP